MTPARPRVDALRTRWFGLTLVLAAGAALRFWNISAGLPYRIGFDEPVIAERAIQIMKSGDFNPHFFDYPGLYIYVQAAVGCLRFLTGAMNGYWRSLDAFFPEHLFLWTRLLNAALGTTTIYALYRAGVRWGRCTALLAAVLLACWGNHVRESHFALTDVPLTLLTTSAFVLSLRALEEERVVWFLAAGASVGLAAGAKYNGAIALVMPLVAAAGTSGPWAWRGGRGVAAVAAAAGAFFVAAPYTVLDLPGFLNAFADMSTSYQPRPLGQGVAIYLGHMEVAGGWLSVRVAVAGLAWSVVKAVRERQLARWAVFLAFPLVYLEVVATKQQIFARYLLPFMPFFCLVLAIVIVDVWTWAFSERVGHRPWLARARQAVAVVLAVAVVWPVARTGIGWPRSYGMRTTQDAAYRLILQTVPAGSGVAVENMVLRLPDSKYRPRNVRRLVDRSPEELVAAGITYGVTSSNVVRDVFAHPVIEHDAIAAYRRLFDAEGRCLPPIEPSAKVAGPTIRLCRLTP